MMPLIRFYEEHDQKRTVRRMLNIFYRSGLLVPVPVLEILGLFSSGKKVGSGSGQRDPDPKRTNSSPAAA